jgi:peptidoglycan/LPS O-acetylase OafA/YrhL
MNEPPKRFYSLDVLRGLGALIIVLTHWHSFFFIKVKVLMLPTRHFTSYGDPFMRMDGSRALAVFRGHV